jgi:hypothetical protein
MELFLNMLFTGRPIEHLGFEDALLVSAEVAGIVPPIHLNASKARRTMSAFGMWSKISFIEIRGFVEIVLARQDNRDVWCGAN